jgi:membrane-bound serine protease (ClpP class)
VVVSAPEHLLSAIADPNIALLLVVLGAFGIYAEFCLPGLLAPGVIGAIFLFLGLTALSRFPITRTGAALMILGLVFCVLEARWPARGILTALGAATLIDTAHSDLHVRWSTAIALSIPFALITSFLLSVAIRARRNKVVCV